MLVVALTVVFLFPAQQQKTIQEQVKEAVSSLEGEIKSLKEESKALREREIKRNTAALQRAERRVKERRRELDESLKKEEAVKAGLDIKTEQAAIDHEMSLPLVSIDEKKIDTSLMTAENQRLVIALIAERAALREKIRRANGRWHCRLLRLGCIGTK
jgi:hypothetical protein